MSGTKQTRYCWDTSVVLDWLTEDATKPIADIELVQREIDAKRCILVLPVLVITEVLRCKRTPAKFRQWEKFLRRSNVEIINVTPPIARKAEEIRSRGELETPHRRKIKTPDAIIAATAIIESVEVLHATDASDLRKLSRKAIVEGLRIDPPGVITSGDTSQRSLPEGSHGEA